MPLSIKLKANGPLLSFLRNTDIFAKEESKCLIGVWWGLQGSKNTQRSTKTFS